VSSPFSPKVIREQPPVSPSFFFSSGLFPPRTRPVSRCIVANSDDVHFLAKRAAFPRSLPPFLLKAGSQEAGGPLLVDCARFFLNPPRKGTVPLSPLGGVGDSRDVQPPSPHRNKVHVFFCGRTRVPLRRVIFPPPTRSVCENWHFPPVHPQSTRGGSLVPYHG